jgi:sulfatase maturation enzyme AslB (radical SAM superfamily)
LRSRRWKQWFRAYFAEQLMRYQQTGRRFVPCSAGRTSFFLNYDGGVYACNMLNDRLGDIAENDIETIFAKPEVRERVSSLECCQACWTSCNVGEALRQHPLRMLAWVARHKIHHPKSMTRS